MTAPEQHDLLKSLDRIIEKFENKLKDTRVHANLIDSQPEEKGILSLQINGAK